jgi:hypothetical protein
MKRIHSILSAETGELRLAVVGGSFSITPRHTPEALWINKVVRRLRALYPRHNITAYNGCVGATGPPLGRVGHYPTNMLGILFEE